jgi:NTE family protein
VPSAPEAISDRRNELIGNVSLFQQLDSITFVNELMLKNAFRKEFLSQFDIHEPVRIPCCFSDDEHRPYHIPFSEMSAELQATLDYESKIDRSKRNISTLMADGEKQGRAFLNQHKG